MPKKSVKGAGRIRQVTNKTVWNRGERYSEIWGVEGTLSAGIAALDLLDPAGREKAIEIAKGIAEEKQPIKMAETKPVRPSILDAVDAVKYATVHYRLHSKEEQEALDELRRILAPPKKPKKRRAKGG